MKRISMLLPLALLSIAAANTQADSFTGVEGLSYGDRVDTRKDWTHVEDDHTANFFSHNAAHSAFLGLMPTGEVAIQSKGHKVAVAFMLSFRPGDCDALLKAAEAKWGPSERISSHEVEWLGKIIDLSLDTAGGACQLSASDRRWDDTHDEFKKR